VRLQRGKGVRDNHYSGHPCRQAANYLQRTIDPPESCWKSCQLSTLWLAAPKKPVRQGMSGVSSGSREQTLLEGGVESSRFDLSHTTLRKGSFQNTVSTSRIETKNTSEVVRCFNISCAAGISIPRAASAPAACSPYYHQNRVSKYWAWYAPSILPVNLRVPLHIHCIPQFPPLFTFPTRKETRACVRLRVRVRVCTCTRARTRTLQILGASTGLRGQ
jgi:hypothetical protein